MVYCQDCGNTIPENQKCGHCDQPSKVSLPWFLLPIFIGIIGGLIMYYVVRERNREQAKLGLWIGLILTLVNALPVFIILGISGIFASI